MSREISDICLCLQAIVCRVGMKRAGGRVNKLKLKLPPGIVMLHTFGTTSPRRPTAVIQSTQLSDGE